MKVLTLTYGQEIKKSEVQIITKPEKTNSENTITLSSRHIIIENKLDLEADSAQYDSDKKILTAFGTKKFAFNGKVVVDKGSRICKFNLRGDAPSEAIIE
jgi:hypothetical protein